MSRRTEENSIRKTILHDPAEVGSPRLLLRTCSDHSHFRVSRGQLYDLEKHRSIKWVAIRYRDEDLVPIENPPDIDKQWDGGVMRISMVFGFRGVSACVGEYLADALQRRESWALAMHDQIRGRSYEARSEPEDGPAIAESPFARVS
jgi:hypothetical protein